MKTVEKPVGKIERDIYIGTDTIPPDVYAIIDLDQTPHLFKTELYLRIALDSHAIPSVEWFDRTWRLIETIRSDGKPIFIRCDMKTSAMVVVAYIMRQHGLSRDNAIKYVNQRHEIKLSAMSKSALAEYQEHLEEDAEWTGDSE